MSIWKELLPADVRSGYELENKTLDLMIQGCYSNYNTTACVRNSFLSILSIFSLGFCLRRLLFISPQENKHYTAIFVMASLESICLLLKNIYNHNLAIYDFVACYLKLMQFLLLCHFHWTRAGRIFKHELCFSRLSFLIVILSTIYFLFITVLGIDFVKAPWVECFELHWLLLAIPEFIIVQFMLIAAILIHKKINSVISLSSFKAKQKVILWSIVAAYETSATVCLTNQIVMTLLKDEAKGCSSLYQYRQGTFSAVHSVLMIFQYFLPIWVICWFVKPTPKLTTEEREGLLGSSSTSSFSTGSNTIYRPFFFNSSGESINRSTNRSSSPIYVRPATTSNTPVCSPNNLDPISEEEDGHVPPHPPIIYRSHGSLFRNNNTYGSLSSSVLMGGSS